MVMAIEARPEAFGAQENVDAAAQQEKVNAVAARLKEIYDELAARVARGAKARGVPLRDQFLAPQLTTSRRGRVRLRYNVLSLV